MKLISSYNLKHIKAGNISILYPIIVILAGMMPSKMGDGDLHPKKTDEDKRTSKKN